MKRRRRRRRRASTPPEAPPASRRDAVAKLLLLSSAVCLLALPLAGRLASRSWDAIHFALLYHGALATAVLSSAIGWRSSERDLRWAARLFVLVALVTWAHTWSSGLQDFTAWFARARFLWLEV